MPIPIPIDLEPMVVQLVVQLSPQIEARIARFVATGHDTDAQNVGDAGLRLLAEQEHARQIHLRALIRERFPSGEPVELTDDLMDESEREAEEAVMGGDVLSPMSARSISTDSP